MSITTDPKHTPTPTEFVYVYFWADRSIRVEEETNPHLPVIRTITGRYHLDVLRAIESTVAKEKVDYMMIIGETPVSERRDFVRRFQEDDKW